MQMTQIQTLGLSVHASIIFETANVKNMSRLKYQNMKRPCIRYGYCALTYQVKLIEILFIVPL